MPRPYTKPGMKTARLVRSYLGFPGCGCGCRGDYTSEPAEVQDALDFIIEDPDFTINIDDTQVIFVLEDPNTYYHWVYADWVQ